jgi:osmotically-inducible protein OsmY
MPSATVVLEPTRPASDSRLQRAVGLTLQSLPGQAGRRLQVAAEGGVVTLAGRARSFYEKQLLLSAVRRVPGVERIVDEVAVVSG